MTAAEMITSEMEKKPRLTPEVKTKSIVVATDGSDTALAAFNVAAMITGKMSADVHVLTVLEPMPLLFPSVEGMIVPPELDRSREEAQRTIVIGQIKTYDPARAWTLDVSIGRPAEAIVSFAQEQNADLIILGMNKHGLVGRILGEETAGEVARLSSVPLLIAAPQMNRLPKRVLIAIGLNADGMQSAPEVIRMITEAPSVSCVHVRPRSEFLGVDWAEFDNEYELAMKERFREVENNLEAANLRGDLVVLNGDATRELTEFITYSKVELLVVGVKRRRGRSRAIGGRMAARLIRGVSCSVLVIPDIVPRERAFGAAAGSTSVVHDSKMWPGTLRDFTARNAGRIVNLEVDDPEAGALMEATAYPLLGADYDHKDGRLTITLGYTRGLERHLSRTISHPETVSVLSINGRDTALAVTHGGGQTLLTF
jgi:nucleotide-binding universal stress UspA family protein